MLGRHLWLAKWKDAEIVRDIKTNREELFPEKEHQEYVLCYASSIDDLRQAIQSHIGCDTKITTLCGSQYLGQVIQA